MVIQIQMLTMRNFKGVLGERKIEFSPTVTQVLGANKTGKTTIADAFRWCLFGKNSEGKSEFGIKTKDEEGNVLPELSHEVEVALLVD
ncbi:ATP-binding protein, partial [Veillonella nakazawae]|nr:ATP-binding protein [Veillonella nakazawae]